MMSLDPELQIDRNYENQNNTCVVQSDAKELVKMQPEQLSDVEVKQEIISDTESSQDSDIELHRIIRNPSIPRRIKVENEDQNNSNVTTTTDNETLQHSASDHGTAHTTTNMNQNKPKEITNTESGISQDSDIELVGFTEPFDTDHDSALKIKVENKDQNNSNVTTIVKIEPCDEQGVVCGDNIQWSHTEDDTRHNHEPSEDIPLKTVQILLQQSDDIIKKTEESRTAKSKKIKDISRKQKKNDETHSNAEETSCKIVTCREPEQNQLIPRNDVPKLKLGKKRKFKESKFECDINIFSRKQKKNDETRNNAIESKYECDTNIISRKQKKNDETRNNAEETSCKKVTFSEPEQNQLIPRNEVPKLKLGKKPKFKESKFECDINIFSKKEKKNDETRNNAEETSCKKVTFSEPEQNQLIQRNEVPKLQLGEKHKFKESELECDINIFKRKQKKNDETRNNAEETSCKKVTFREPEQNQLTPRNDVPKLKLGKKRKFKESKFECDINIFSRKQKKNDETRNNAEETSCKKVTFSEPEQNQLIPRNDVPTLKLGEKRKFKESKFECDTNIISRKQKKNDETRNNAEETSCKKVTFSEPEQNQLLPRNEVPTLKLGEKRKFKESELECDTNIFSRKQKKNDETRNNAEETSCEKVTFREAEQNELTPPNDVPKLKLGKKPKFKESKFECDINIFSRKQKKNDETRNNAEETSCEKVTFSEPEQNQLIPRNDVPTLKLGEKRKFKESKFECDICKNIFSWKSLLIRHIRIHTGEKPFKCKLCQKYFSRKSSLEHHTRLHAGEKPFECEVCKKRFSVKSNLTQHAHVHAVKKPFECGVCKKRYSLKSNLANHARTHSGNKPFECEICNKYFSHNYQLNAHILIHTGRKPFKCEVCEKSFGQNADLAKHARTHTSEKPFQCDVCKKRFSLMSYLAQHARVHTGEKPFKCNVCKKCFANKSNLSKHMHIHTGSKFFECDVCKKRFTQKSDLVKHIRTHTATDEKRFECDVCKKRFCQNSELIFHTRKHTGEKPFKCEVCKKRFSQKAYLAQHARIHTGAKPYECIVCKKRFIDKKGLNSHARTHARSEPFNCSLCKKYFSHKSALDRHTRAKH